MSIEKVVVIIPTYNESLTIEETLAAVFRETAAIQDKAVHVLVFDSASTDNTQQLVRQLQPHYPYLHLQTEPQKSGLGSAYLQAMRFALHQMQADIVVEFDADLSHQPRYLAPMLAQLDSHDVVVGSRYTQGGSIPTHWGWHRKLLSVLGNYIARSILTPKYKDFTSGFRATRRAALLQALPDAFLSNQYAYKLHLLWLLHKNRARIVEYPIAFVDRQKGHSKLPTNSITDALRVIFLLRLQTLTQYFKMCLVGLVGVLVQLVVYNLLRAHYAPAQAMKVAVLAAILNNFILNTRFTFKQHFFATWQQKVKAVTLFIGYSVIMIYLQSGWLTLGIKYLGAGYLKENCILISAVVLGSVLNYLIYSRLVWRQGELNLLPSN